MDTRFENVIKHGKYLKTSEQNGMISNLLYNSHCSSYRGLADNALETPRQRGTNANKRRRNVKRVR